MPLGTWELLYGRWSELESVTTGGVTRFDPSPGALVQMTPADAEELAPTEETELWINP